MLIIIWRGYGWLVPVIALAALFFGQIAIDSVYGENFHKEHEWPNISLIGASAVVIGLMGYLLNYKYRTSIFDKKTGRPKKSPPHSFFLIPVQFWAVIVPVLFFVVSNYYMSEDAKQLAYLTAPEVNDRYLVDYTKIFDETDKTYKYGLVKVINVFGENVETLISDVAYDKQWGPVKDITDGKINNRDYYTTDSKFFKINELMRLKESDAIYSVSRN